MSLMSPNSLVFSAAIFTVSVDPVIAEQAVRVISEMPWLVTSTSFEAYISDDRRPYISPQSKAANACIALVDFDKDRELALETTRYLQHVFGNKATVIALSDALDQGLLLEAMRAGCKEFLLKPLQPKALLEAISRLQADWLAATSRSAPVGTLLSFMGAKGGVGTTTLAVHTAVYLAKSHGKRTLLIDTRPALGHVSIYLGLDGSKFHFQEVVKNVRRLDSALLQASVATHSSGLHVLSSPDSWNAMDAMDAESVKRTLDFLTTEYDFVVMDCASELNGITLAVMQASTKIYLVASPELGAVRDLSRYLDTLMQDPGIHEKIHVVLNRCSSRYAVNEEQIEKAIKQPVEIRLPNSYTELVKAINLGEPLDSKAKSEFAAQMNKWVSNLTGGAPAAAAPAPAPARGGVGLFRKRLVPST